MDLKNVDIEVFEYIEKENLRQKCSIRGTRFNSYK